VAAQRCRLTVVVLALFLAGCGGSEPSADTAAVTPDGTTLVALGDSDATGAGDPDGGGWVQRYADLVEKESGSSVEVLNRAEEGLTSGQLLDRVQHDDALREELSGADLVVLGAGGADLNAGDDAWAAGTCTGNACYEPALTAYATSIDQVMAEVAALRDGRPTVLRAITLPNVLPGAESVVPPFLQSAATTVGVFQTQSLRTSTCTAVRAHGGECIDVLTAFNGPDGTQDAYATGLLTLTDCCYPSGDGQQQMAELLLATGTTAVPLH
jgi:lysophospholipase L1-like esterase